MTYKKLLPLIVTIGFLWQLTDCKRTLYYQEIEDVRKFELDTPWIQILGPFYNNDYRDTSLVIDTDSKYKNICDSIWYDTSSYNCNPPINLKKRTLLCYGYGYNQDGTVNNVKILKSDKYKKYKFIINVNRRRDYINWRIECRHIPQIPKGYKVKFKIK